MKFKDRSDQLDKIENDQHDYTKITRRCYLHTSALIIGIAQVFIGKSSALDMKAQEIVEVCIMLCLTSHLHTIRIKAGGLVLYINSHFGIHNTLGHPTMSQESRKHITLTEKLSKFYAQIFVFTGITFPTALLALHWIQPCRASVPGYWLLPECTENGTNFISKVDTVLGCYLLQNFVKLVVLGFNLWTWQYGVNASVFIICGLITLGSTCIQRHLMKLV